MEQQDNALRAGYFPENVSKFPHAPFSISRPSPSLGPICSQKEKLYDIKLIEKPTHLVPENSRKTGKERQGREGVL